MDGWMDGGLSPYGMLSLALLLLGSPLFLDALVGPFHIITFVEVGLLLGFFSHNY
jgi:hypothetical protein